jgi:hypothetical protein
MGDIRDLQAKASLILAELDSLEPEAKRLIDSNWEDADFLWGFVRAAELHHQGLGREEIFVQMLLERLPQIFETNPPEHLTVVKSDRGFSRLPLIPGDYGGDAQVYESSSAEGPHLWLKVTEPEDLNAHAAGKDTPMKECHLHLPLENAAKLRDQLTWLIDNHYHES